MCTCIQGPVSQRESFDGCNDKREVCSSREFTRSFVRIIQDRAYSFNGALPSGCIQQRRRSWKLSFRAVRRRKRGRHCSRAVRRGAEIGTCTRGVCIWFHGSCILSSITHLRIVIVIIHCLPWTTMMIIMMMMIRIDSSIHKSHPFY